MVTRRSSTTGAQTAAASLSAGPVSNYRPDIDGLRAIAVLAVVGYHAFPSHMQGGFVGVDVFFVISGFLISRVIYDGLREGSFSYTDFYVRRIKRIFPALLVVLGASLAFGWFVLLANEYQQLGKHIAAGAGFAANLIFWHEAGYFDTAAEIKPMLHLWSLGIEEQFYLIWPAVLCVAWKRRFHLLPLIVLVAAASFAFNVRNVSTDVVGAYYSPLSRFWQLLAGAVLAWLMSTREHRFRSSRSTIGIVLILASVFTVSRATTYPGWWALAPTAGAYLIISAGPSAWFNRFVLAFRPMVWVGLISYPLYLWHWPLLSFARIVESGTPSTELRVALVCSSVLLAWITYRYVEMPIRFGTAGSLKVPVMASAMVVLALLGSGAWYLEGLPFRHKELEESLKNIAKVVESSEECRALVPLANMRYCLISDPSKPPTVALIGDSHANTFFEALSEKYRSAGENLLQLGGGGCLPFWDIETGKIGEPNDCVGQMNPQLDYVLQTSSIHTVMFAHRGPVHIAGMDLYRQGRYFIRNVRDPGETNSMSVYHAALTRTVKRFDAAGKDVVLVIDVPEMNFDPMDCFHLRRPLSRADGPKRADCRISREIIDTRSRPYIDVMQAALQVSPRAILLDTREALCDQKYCYAAIDGELLYADPDHPSRQGAKRVAESLWTQLQEARSRRGL